MTDRELLELAAKAAGIELEWGIYERGYCFHRTGTGVRKDWNPLIDDGDALRLAVKLGLSIHCPDEDDDTVVVRNYLEAHIRVNVENDPYAATRRAIVRAAAEIGKG